MRDEEEESWRLSGLGRTRLLLWLSVRRREEVRSDMGIEEEVKDEDGGRGGRDVPVAVVLEDDLAVAGL